MAEASELRLTRAEFAAAVRVYYRQAAWFFSIALLGLFLTFGVISLLINVLEEHGVSRDSLWTVALSFLSLGYMFVVAGLADWLIHRSRVKCASCRAPLLYRSHVVLVTGRCEKCAHPVFADEGLAVERQAESRESGLVSQADVEAAGAAARRNAIRPALKWAVSGAVLLGGGAAAYFMLQPVVESSLGEMWAPFLQPVLIAPGMAVLFWTMAVWARHRFHSCWHCPNCGEGLGQFALQTGNCSSCGQRAVSDPFPGMEPREDRPAAPAAGWTIADFHAVARRRHSRLWIGCFIGVPVALAIVLPLSNSSATSLSEAWGVSDGLVGIGMIVAVLSIQFGGVIWWQRRSSRGLLCPACDRELLQMHSLVVSSRRCYHCGSVVLRDGEASGGEAAV